MTEDRIPIAVWEGELDLFGVTVRCYRLDDGRNIVHADDMSKLFDAMLQVEQKEQEG